MNTTDRILGEAGQVRPPTEEEQTNPQLASNYAVIVLKGRFPEGEAAIATNPGFAEDYLKRFPEAKREWVIRGWLDWFDL
jgi:hypothetical protein